MVAVVEMMMMMMMMVVVVMNMAASSTRTLRVPIDDVAKLQDKSQELLYLVLSYLFD